MRKIENRCCDCATPAYPCRGDICPLRSVEVIYCDKCNDECGEAYGVDDEELCEYCFLKKYRKDRF